IGRESDFDRLLLAGGHADQRGLDLRQHRAGADHVHALLHALRGQALFAGLRPGLHVHRVAFLRRAGDRGPAAALQAQVLDHAVDVLFAHLGGVAHHFQLGDVDLAEVRDQLEGGDVGQLPAALALAGRLDLRVARDLQLVLADDLVEALAQQPVQDLGADLLAEALLDHAGRHLAGAETLDPRGPRDFAQAAADLVVDIPGRDAERHAPLEIADG